MENGIFEEQKVSRAYIKLSLPLVLSMVVTLIYNLADTYFVARTGNTALVAGVSLGMPIFTFLMAIGNIFGQGGSSLISRLLGQNEKQKAGNVSSFCFYATLLIGIAVGALMLIFRPSMLRLIGADEETIIHASAYYTWLAIGSPAVMLSFIHSNLLRAEGLSRESMIGTVSGAVVNIILDPVFISVLGMGAAGAAIASVIGYLVSDVYFAIIVVLKSRSLSMNPRRIRVSKSETGQIFGIGIPAAIVNIMQSASAVIVNQALLPFGNDRIAAMGIVQKVSMIALLLLTGFAFGGQPLFGYYFGAEDRKRLKELFHFCLRFISVMAIILTVFIFIFAPALIKVFMDDESIISTGTLMLRLQVITMVCVGFILLMTIISQSIGNVIASFILSISRQGIIFLAVLFIAYRLSGYMGIIAAQAVSDIVTAVIAFVIYRKTVRTAFIPYK